MSAVAVERLDARTAVVAVAGDPLGTAADELGARVVALIEDGVAAIVVDFSALPVLNSKLLDALVRASARQAVPGPGGIAVVTGQSYVRQILEISETGGVVLLADTRDEGLEALRG